MASPQLVAVVPCEDLLQTVAWPDRRPTLHRVFYDLIARQFPARARIPITVIFCGGSGTYAGRVRLVDPAEQEVASGDFAFIAATFFVQLVVFGGAGNLVELPFPGKYNIEVLLEEQVIARVPLTVVLDQSAVATVAETERAPQAAVLNEA